MHLRRLRAHADGERIPDFGSFLFALVMLWMMRQMPPPETGHAPGLRSILMVSGLFRGVIWNETIPNAMRGRMSGIEMISYLSGPLLGNARAGWIATLASTRISISSGGILCVAGVILCGFLLPGFWHYSSAAAEKPQASPKA